MCHNFTYSEPFDRQKQNLFTARAAKWPEFYSAPMTGSRVLADNCKSHSTCQTSKFQVAFLWLWMANATSFFLRSEKEWNFVDLTGAVSLTVICQNLTPYHRCRLKFWSFCQTSCAKIFLLATKRFRKGENMTRTTTFFCLTHCFFLLILIRYHIRNIIYCCWVSTD